MCLNKLDQPQVKCYFLVILVLSPKRGLQRAQAMRSWHWILFELALFSVFLLMYSILTCAIHTLYTVQLFFWCVEVSWEGCPSDKAAGEEKGGLVTDQTQAKIQCPP